jgi:hypothetical protein
MIFTFSADNFYFLSNAKWQNNKCLPYGRRKGPIYYEM